MKQEVSLCARALHRLCGIREESPGRKHRKLPSPHLAKTRGVLQKTPIKRRRITNQATELRSLAPSKVPGPLIRALWPLFTESLLFARGPRAEVFVTLSCSKTFPEKFPGFSFSFTTQKKKKKSLV